MEGHMLHIGTEDLDLVQNVDQECLTGFGNLLAYSFPDSSHFRGQFL